jgi:acyl-CoA dehydrogenase
MSTAEETAMIRETVAKFVDRELIPLEPHYLKSKLPGSDHPELTSEQKQRLRTVSKDLGLWGLDAPEDLGGHDLPPRTMAAVYEELGRTCVPFVLPPDSPNLRMMQAVGTEAQKKKYMQPYIEGRMSSAIAISEPGAGGDPAAMKTRAVLDGAQWVLNGRKIWISNARAADFVIVMARVGTDARQGGITSFIVEKGTPGFIIEREIPMLGGGSTYEIVFEDCRIPADSVLGEVGKGYAPMQLRLRTRRLEMGSTCIGIARRARDVMCEHAKQRETFGVKSPSARRSSGGLPISPRGCMRAG